MNLLEAAISFVESNQEKAARMTSNHQEKNRRSREERRHGGCAKGRGQTPAQQERRSGRKGPQACKASSVRFPARRLAVERRDWLQRQDLNLRHRGYEPRGMTASLRCFGKMLEASLDRLLWTGNSKRPNAIIRPIGAKPCNDLIVLLGREGFPASNSRKETAIGSAVPPDSRLAKILSRTECVRERQQVVCELRFHAAVIVGHFPLCNRKHPIRFGRGKFPIIAA